MSALPHRQQALADVIATFRNWLYLPDPGVVEIVLATFAANRLAGDPVWVLLVGPPGCGKTEALNSLYKLPKIYPASTITEAALLSGTPSRDRAEDSKGGLLRAMGEFGILVLKDFTSTLSMNKDERAKTIAALREIYDGRWTRRLGVDGGRTLDWTGKLGVIGGVTEAIDTHHAVMSSMGERFLLYRLPPTDAEQQARRVLCHQGEEVRMREEMAAAVRDLFEGLPIKGVRAPRLAAAEEERLIALTTLVARCRSSVERHGYTREIEQIPQPEAPGRLTRTLSQLLSGLSVIGVDSSRRRQLLVKTAMDCIPPLRHAGFEYLVKQASPVKTAEAASVLGYPIQTVRRALEDLRCHGILERADGQTGNADFWRVVGNWSQQYAIATGTFPKSKERA